MRKPGIGEADGEGRKGDLLACLLRELKLRPLATGILSNLPGLYAWWDRRRPMGNTASSGYARSIWRFHRENYMKFTNGRSPSSVAEFGPGATLGSCIAALCDGIDTAIGLDVRPYASDSSSNLRVLEELITGSARKADHARLRDAVTRVGSGGRETSLAYVAPWTDPEVLPENSLELIFSHSVMEHVTQPVAAYQACFRWLKPGGIMSHKIDHSSHAITKSWNGHYAIPDGLWSLIVGGRPYLLNRMTPVQHRRTMESAGFEILSAEYETAKDDDGNCSCPSVRNREDCRIKTSTFVCRKPCDGP